MCGCEDTVQYRRISTCDISYEDLISWRNLLIQIKSRGLVIESGIEPRVFNARLGTVLSVLSYTGDYCDMYDRLVQVRDIIPGLQNKFGL